MTHGIVDIMKHNISWRFPLKAIRPRPILFLIVFGFFLNLLYLPSSYTNEQIDKMFDPIASRYGVGIVYEVGDDFFSGLVNPPMPAGPDRRSKVIPIRHSILAKYPVIIEKAFGQYPDHVIKTCIGAIYFAGEIDQNGLKYGGSYDPFRRILYIVDNGYRSEDQSVYTIHHELSSLLLYRKSFFINPWTDNNPPSFRYLYDITGDALKIYNNTSSIGAKPDFEKGFMVPTGRPASKTISMNIPP